MKIQFRNTLALMLAVLMLGMALAGCAQSGSTAADAVAIVSDIATTQYFTDEAVAEADIETIVQAGINAPAP